jgi:hypothetical protein
MENKKWFLIGAIWSFFFIFYEAWCIDSGYSVSFHKIALCIFILFFILNLIALIALIKDRK